MTQNTDGCIIYINCIWKTGTVLKIFEKPLSANEELEYFEKYRNGDEEAREILILRNMRLVAHMVKHYVPADKDRDEMISIGTVGLIKAVMTFDYKKGSRFATYAAKCIDNELLMALRGEKKRNREISINEPIGTDKEGNEINILDTLAIDSSEYIDILVMECNLDILRKAMSCALSERERLILKKRYGLDGESVYPQRELAAQMNISRSYVSRIEKKALGKLRDYFNCVE